LLKEFINVYELKPKSKLSPETEETVNRNLRELVSAVGLTCKPKISFHCFRDLVIRTAQNLGVDVFLYKRMVGKSISRDMRGYPSKDVKEAFEKIQSVISINGQILASQHDDLLSKLIEEVTKLSEALITLQKENSASRTVTETLTHKIKQMEQQQQKTSEALRVLADNTPIIYALLKKDYIKAKQLIDQQKQK